MKPEQLIKELLDFRSLAASYTHMKKITEEAAKLIKQLTEQPK